MVKKGDIITFTEDELRNLIERECKERLGLTFREFSQKRKLGELKESSAVHDIEMLLKLA